MENQIFKLIDQHNGRNTPINLLMIFVSNKIHYVFLFVLILMWFKKNTFRKVAYCAGISSAVTLFIHFLIKLISFKPRPFMKRRVGLLIPSKRDSSFPSKHTLLVFAISTSIFLHERVLGSILYLLSVLTGFSRIWVGHHYPSDIIGSAFISTITSVMIDKIARFFNYFSRR